MAAGGDAADKSFQLFEQIRMIFLGIVLKLRACSYICPQFQNAFENENMCLHLSFMLYNPMSCHDTHDTADKQQTGPELVPVHATHLPQLPFPVHPCRVSPQ